MNVVEDKEAQPRSTVRLPSNNDDHHSDENDDDNNDNYHNYMKEYAK